MHAQLDKLAYAHTSFFTTEPAEAARRPAVADAPDGIGARLFRQRRLGGDRGGAEDGAAVFRRERRAAAPPRHRAPPELSRQHARRARGRRQRMAPRAVRAAADRDPPHRPLLRLSLPRARRERCGLRARAAQALEDKILELGPDTRDRLRRRDRGRRDRGRGAAGRRTISSASARSATATACC